MKNLLFIILTLFFTNVYSQNVGYYNGTDGLGGTTLKAALHQKIKNHTSFSYNRAEQILLHSDADPNIPGNVILIYSGRSADGTDYGTGANQLNREHVWAKSHGGFGTTQPTGTDCHNLKPIDMSINTTRSNKDFDNCPGGTQDAEATECYYTSDAWEPRDAVKGDVARIIFYMATRYEGENGEVDLEPADYVNTYPNPLHGKLSTLLDWNNADPPDSFEIRRNNEIFKWQKNRNPFIDNPNFANLIWNGAIPSTISFDSIYISPEYPKPTDIITIYAKISSSINPLSVNLKWGNNRYQLNNNVSMSENQNVFTCTINPQAANTDVYFNINANDGTNNHSSIIYDIFIPSVYTGSITKIYDIQGQTSSSPYNNQNVTTSGIVTANFGDGYFIQDGKGEWNGIYIFDSERNPAIGDSIVISGQVTEYYGLTEIKNISSYYFCSAKNTLPDYTLLNTNNITEGYEGVRVKVTSARCTNTNSGNNMWKVDDQTGECNIRNSELYTYSPTLNQVYTITGIVNYDFSEYKIDLTSYFDVTTTVNGINSVVALNKNTINVLYNKDVETSTSENISNYFINNGINILSANQNSNLHKLVTLTCSDLSTGYYTLNINNVIDIDNDTILNNNYVFYFQGTNINSNIADKIKISPNPSKKFVFVDTDGLEIKSYSIIDSKGQVINKNNINSNNFYLNVNNLNSGIYYLKLKTNTEYILKKFVKK